MRAVCSSVRGSCLDKIKAVKIFFLILPGSLVCFSVNCTSYLWVASRKERRMGVRAGRRVRLTLYSEQSRTLDELAGE